MCLTDELGYQKGRDTVRLGIYCWTWFIDWQDIIVEAFKTYFHIIDITDESLYISLIVMAIKLWVCVCALCAQKWVALVLWLFMLILVCANLFMGFN